MFTGNTGGEMAIINEYGSLQQFYCMTATLSNHRKVKFVSKEDDADSIEWNFKYRGKALTLLYDIYNGVSLLTTNPANKPAVTELAILLQKTFCF